MDELPGENTADRMIETRTMLAELVQLLIERLQAQGRTVEPGSIEWTPTGRPFFEPAALLERPRTDSNRRRAP
jgi:hypothetical protein